MRVRRRQDCRARAEAHANALTRGASFPITGVESAERQRTTDMGTRDGTLPPTSKEARLAEALRANLARRKALARARRARPEAEAAPRPAPAGADQGERDDGRTR